MNVLILIFAAIGVFAFACMIAFFIALAIDARRETQVQDYMQATGWFNKACEYYADQYDVDVDDVKREVKKRQAAGRKAKHEKRKYYYFAVEYSIGGERTNGCNYFEAGLARYNVLKATKAENVEKRLSENDDFSEYGNQTYFGRIEKFDSESEACEKAWEWKKENEEKNRKWSLNAN